MKAKAHEKMGSNNQSNDKDLLLGKENYLKLLKMTLYALGIPYCHKITRTGVGNSKDMRNYDNSITYILDGLNAMLEYKLGKETKTKLKKDMIEITKLNEQLHKCESTELREKLKEKIAKLIGVPISELDIPRFFEVAHLEDALQKTFSENFFINAINYVQGIIHFDPKKSIYHFYEISFSDINHQISPSLVSMSLCFKELSKKFLVQTFKALALRYSRMRPEYLSIFYDLNRQLEFPLMFNENSSRWTDTAESNTIYEPRKTKQLNAPFRIQNNEFTLIVFDVLKAAPIHANTIFNGELLVDFIGKNKESVLVARGEANSTFLHQTCANGDYTATKRLIDLGADLAAEDDYGFTPLLAATLMRRFDIVQLLLETARSNRLDLDSIKLHESAAKSTAVIDTPYHVSYIAYKFGLVREYDLITSVYPVDIGAFLRLALANNDKPISLKLIHESEQIDPPSLVQILATGDLDLINSCYKKLHDAKEIIGLVCLYGMDYFDLSLLQNAIKFIPESLTPDILMEIVIKSLLSYRYEYAQLVMKSGLKWLNNDMADYLFDIALDNSSFRIFKLLHESGVRLSDPQRMLLRAIETNNPSICLYLLDSDFCNICVEDAELFYGLLAEFPDNMEIASRCLEQYNGFSLARIFCLGLSEEIQLACIAHCSVDRQDITQITQMINQVKVSTKVVDLLIERNLMCRQVDHTKTAPLITCSVISELGHLGFPRKDIAGLVEKIGWTFTGDLKENSVVRDYLFQRQATIEALQAFNLSQNLLQRLPLSGLLQQLYVHKPVTPLLAKPAITDSLDRVSHGFFSSTPAQWVFEGGIQFIELSSVCTLKKLRARNNQFVVCSHLESLMADYDQNIISYFSDFHLNKDQLSRMDQQNSDSLCSAHVKMIRERNYKARVMINGTEVILNARAEVKARGTKSRILLAELTCNLPGAPKIYLPVMISKTGFHDHRYKNGMIFSCGKLDLIALDNSKSIGGYSGGNNCE